MGNAASAADIALLVVDDDEDHRELIVAALSGHVDRSRIATASSGGAALDFLLARGVHASRNVRRQPRLVLLDMRLGPMDGLEVLHAIRAAPETARLPVVMLSSGAQQTEVESCYQAGANGVVRKSVDFGEMRRKMAVVYAYWITVNEVFLGPHA